MSGIETLRWKNDALHMVDQTKLPMELVYIDCTTIQHVYDAIRTLTVRGAPAIGIAGAYGAYIGVRECAQGCTKEQFIEKLRDSCDYLASSRPTAVNLQWALDRVRTRAREVLSERDVPAAVQAVLEEAHAILDEDITMCRTIGENGQEVLQSCHTVLTHCNAGGLATSGYGTALAPVYVAAEQGHAIHVYADETRPLLQGARITAFELQQVGVPVTVICDSMAAWTMKKGKVDVVIVGADRIAANGDTANKIGTYGLAIAAHHHNVPFYVAAPYSTFDYDLPTGTDIPIEERAPDEITCGFGRQTAPDNVDVYNPAFDVTPVELISGIITEKGVWYP